MPSYTLCGSEIAVDALSFNQAAVRGFNQYLISGYFFI
jgi:hypothetical protein